LLKAVCAPSSAQQKTGEAKIYTLDASKVSLTARRSDTNRKQAKELVSKLLVPHTKFLLVRISMQVLLLSLKRGSFLISLVET